jgi:hypothetical protein
LVRVKPMAIPWLLHLWHDKLHQLIHPVHNAWFVRLGRPERISGKYHD